MSSRSADAADRLLSSQPSGPLVVPPQAAAFVVDDNCRLLLTSCLKRNHKRRGSHRFC
ncbi:hypothetical protein Fuma_02303 [Fuerstiella marisgermanici]|uniref:Uncharacterized protein n=1 Tax=Fuerstiella marisgermanici TaxID=1891926 RepID=A0A1P8WF66_9PLAN|nr:hypothetical protein Fuma_02303 [Fuerstiella marisgermanici]